MTLRLCRTCDQLVDTDNPDIEILQSHGRGSGHTTVRDRKTRLVHILISETMTKKWTEKQAPKAELTTVCKPAPTPPVVAPAPPSFEEATFLALVAAVAKEEGQRIAREKAVQNAETTRAVPVAHPELVYVPEETWVPDPEEIYEATIVQIFDGYMFATLTNSERVYCWMNNISTPLPNEHRCLIYIGDAIGVKITRSERGGSQWQATEIILTVERPVPELPERGTVVRWTDNMQSGHVQRDCECRIFVNVREPQCLNVGDRVEVSDYELYQNRVQARTCEPIWGSSGIAVEDYIDKEHL